MENGHQDEFEKLTKLNLKKNTFVKDGYDFIGWSENSTATKPTYYDEQLIKINHNMNLYAVWQEDSTPCAVKIRTTNGKLFKYFVDETTSILAKDFYKIQNRITDTRLIKEVEIFDDITKLTSDTFAGCTNLQSIKLPDTVTDIPQFFTNGCSNITTFKLPSNLKTIGIWGVHIKNSDFTLPSTVTSLGDCCISLNGTSKIKICKTLTHIGTRILSCVYGSSITVDMTDYDVGDTIPTLSYVDVSSYYETYNSTTIKVRSEAVKNKFTSDSSWSNIAGRFVVA